MTFARREDQCEMITETPSARWSHLWSLEKDHKLVKRSPNLWEVTMTSATL